MGAAHWEEAEASEGRMEATAAEAWAPAQGAVAVAAADVETKAVAPGAAQTAVKGARRGAPWRSIL